MSDCCGDSRVTNTTGDGERIRSVRRRTIFRANGGSDTALRQAT